MPLSTGASRRVAAAPRSTGFGSAAVDGPRRRRGREPRRPSDREKIGGAEKTSVDDAGKTRRPAARREQVPVHGAPAQRLDRGLVPAREPISLASNVAKPRDKTISPASNVANRMVQDHAPQQSNQSGLECRQQDGSGPHNKASASRRRYEVRCPPGLRAAAARRAARTPRPAARRRPPPPRTTTRGARPTAPRPRGTGSSRCRPTLKLTRPRTTTTRRPPAGARPTWPSGGAARARRAARLMRPSSPS